MPVVDTVSDRLDGVVRAMSGLEAKGVRFLGQGGRVSASDKFGCLTQADRAWIQERQQDLLDVLQVRPIRPLDQDPDFGRRFDLAPPQVGMWMGAGHPDPAVYSAVAATNQAIRILCLGPIHLEGVERAFRRLASKHPALRARFDRDAPRQSFHPVDEMGVAYRDLRGSDETTISSILKDAERAGCEFFGGKLARAFLWRCGDAVHVFHLVCHHVIIDAWSGPILTRDFISAYLSGPDDDDRWREQGRLYFGYLDWEQSPGRRARKRLAARRWRRWLADAPSHPVSVRLDRPRTGEVEVCDAVWMETLDAGASLALKRAALDRVATAGAIATTAIMLLLAEESGCDRPLALMLDSGRWRPEQARLCSFFATPLPLCMSVHPQETLEAHVMRVGEILAEWRRETVDWAALLEAYPHRPMANPDRLAAFTFNVVSSDMRRAGVTAGRPSVPAGYPARARGCGPGPGSSGVRFEPRPVEYPGYPNPGDLCLHFEIAERLNCAWNYNSRLIEPDTLRRLSVRLTELICQICDRPATTVAETICVPSSWGRQA